MKISQCVRHFYNYQKMNVKKNTLRNCEFILSKFQNHFGDLGLSSITPEDILGFMSKVSDGTKQNTKKLRFTLLSAFFNFVINSIRPKFFFQHVLCSMKKRVVGQYRGGSGFW